MKSQGLSLADIGELHEDVPIGPDNHIRVFAISAEAALALINKHPTVISSALSGGGIKFGDMVKAAPEVVSAILVLATGGDPDDEKQIAAAKKVALEIQMDILEATGRLTFKNGFGPFAKRIMQLAEAGAALASASSGAVPDMRSPQESNS